jgi:hypothetical protein
MARQRPSRSSACARVFGFRAREKAVRSLGSADAGIATSRPRRAGDLDTVHLSHVPTRIRLEASEGAPKAAVLIIASEAAAGAADALCTAYARMQFANSSWAVVGRRKGEEGQQTPCPAMKVSGLAAVPPHHVRPSGRRKLIGASDKGYFIRRPGRLDGRTCGRHRGN